MLNNTLSFVSYQILKFTNFSNRGNKVDRVRSRRRDDEPGITTRFLHRPERIERRISRLWNSRLPSKSLWIRVGRINHGRFNVISRFRFDAPTFRAHHRGIFLCGVVFCTVRRRTGHKAYAARCPLHLLRYVISLSDGEDNRGQGKGIVERDRGEVEISKSGTKVDSLVNLELSR